MYYDEQKRKIYLHKSNPYLNYINIPFLGDRELQVLNPENETGKGPNSSIYLVVAPDDENEDLVIKFCNYYRLKDQTHVETQIVTCFRREIGALGKAREKGFQNIIEIFGNNELKIGERYFMYYVMERADCDLRDYLTKNNEISFPERLKICRDILMSVKNLHDIEIYHRDIKPDNFFMFGNTWKIGDLGLIAHRHEEQKHRGLLGPKGFMSPESTNKFYAYRDLADRAIDEKSDLFQLGKLFWYILQGDVPAGQTLPDDYIDADKRVYNDVLLRMLYYSKDRRADIEAVERALTPICFEYAAV